MMLPDFEVFEIHTREGIFFEKNVLRIAKSFMDADWAGSWKIEDQLEGIVARFGAI